MENKHFLQSKYWAEVRAKMGHIPVWVDDSLVLIKPVKTPFKNFGYMPQVDLTKLHPQKLTQIAQEYDLSHIQLDPVNETKEFKLVNSPIKAMTLSPTESIYYRDTLVIDLQKSEQDLLSDMHKKHRYNIRVSEKHGVEVEISDSDSDYKVFETLFFETVLRQKYFGRSPEYYRTIWNTLKPLGKVKIATARYQGAPLVSWMLFLDEHTIYYPYGGSSEKFRNVMAANGLVWGIIRWGKDNGYQFLDLWGIDPQTPSQGQKPHGFSDFKIRFGGEQIHYAPSYDIIFQPTYYSLFKIANNLRWLLLRIKKSIKR